MSWLLCCGCVRVDVESPLYFEFVPLCLPSRSLKQLPRTRSSQSSEPWRRRDVPRAGRPPRRRAARGRPSGRPSAARRGAGRSAVRAGASPRRAATMPEAFVQFSLRCCDVSKIGGRVVCVCVCGFFCARDSFVASASGFLVRSVSTESRIFVSALLCSEGH